MIVPALDKSTARAWLSAKREGSETQGTPYEIGAHPREDAEQRIASIESRLSKLTADIDEGEQRHLGRFDAQAAEIIHSELFDLPTQVAADRSFWRFLACGPLFKIVEWRYPDSDNEDNFGLGRLWECLPERLWYRAKLSILPNHKDPYCLTRRGGIDFWVSGIIRPAYGAYTAIVRALVEFQFPEEGEYFPDGSYRPQTLLNNDDGIREVYKRLKHWITTTELSALTDEDASLLIQELAADLPRANLDAH